MKRLFLKCIIPIIIAVSIPIELVSWVLYTLLAPISWLDKFFWTVRIEAKIYLENNER